MSLDPSFLLLQVTPFAIATSVTPGPNNFMLLASGASFGVARTVPHMLGITLGFPVMIVAVALGLAPIVERSVAFHLLLHLGGLAYLLWLAWRVATSGPAVPSAARARPLSLLGAAAFQWVNPKAWILALGSAAAFTTVGGDVAAEIAMVALIFGLVSLPSCLLWAGMGDMVGRLVTSPRWVTAFNVTMALLIVLSVLPTAIGSVLGLLQGHGPVPTTAG